MEVNVFCVSKMKLQSEFLHELRTDPDHLVLHPDALKQILEFNHIRIVDVDGSIIVPRLWERYAVKPKTLTLESTMPDPEKTPVLKGKGLLKRLKTMIRD